jgi:electron transport complex protein RnfD
MTYWIKPTPATKGFFLDAVSTATPLGQSKAEIISSGKITGVYNDIAGYATGYMPGSLGEVSAIALIIGGIYLLAKRIITWHIPLSYLAGFLAIVIPSWLISPEKTLSPVIHLFTGGLMLGVFFMATDMVTSPVSKKGQIIFGLGCGILTAVIRLFGSYPEGVSFAILIMNAVVPLIDYYMRPESFGEVRGEK